MRYNVVLVIVDCLRLDRAETMDFLSTSQKFNTAGHWFDNHWATSHCTDPCVTHMLTGKHPDELRLYSMMFNRKEYTIPEVGSIFNLANRENYTTGFITNLQRWYARMGADHFMDIRHTHPCKQYEAAQSFLRNRSSLI